MGTVNDMKSIVLDGNVTQSLLDGRLALRFTPIRSGALFTTLTAGLQGGSASARVVVATGKVSVLPGSLDASSTLVQYSEQAVRKISANVLVSPMDSYGNALSSAACQYFRIVSLTEIDGFPPLNATTELGGAVPIGSSCQLNFTAPDKGNYAFFVEYSNNDLYLNWPAGSYLPVDVGRGEMASFPANCLLGQLPSALVAGQGGAAILTLIDVENYPTGKFASEVVTASLVPEGAVAALAAPTNTSAAALTAGAFSISMLATKSGDYVLNVTVNGYPIKDSPFRVKVVAAAFAAAPTLPAKRDSGAVIAGSPATFDLVAKDDFGNPVDPLAPLTFTASLFDAYGQAVTVEDGTPVTAALTGAIVSVGVMRYTAAFTIGTAGTYSVSVRESISGADLAPVLVTVVAAPAQAERTVFGSVASGGLDSFPVLAGQVQVRGSC